MEIKSEWLKALALVVSSIWVLCLGPVLTFIALINVDSGGQPWIDQWRYPAAYVLFGLMPVWEMTKLFEKHNNPIGVRGMTVLAIFAASPLWFFLLIIFP